MAHPFTAYLGAGYLNAAALADDALKANALVLAAVALPVPSRTEDFFAEKPVLLRLERAIVNGLWLLDLTEGPLANVLCGRKTDAELVEEVDVKHVSFLLPCVVEHTGYRKL
jgi:hypothetical protein